MTRAQLAHILRAASRIAETTEVMVVGSQAILASFDDSELPDEAIGFDRSRRLVPRRP